MVKSNTANATKSNKATPKVSEDLVKQKRHQQKQKQLSFTKRKSAAKQGVSKPSMKQDKNKPKFVRAEQLVKNFRNTAKQSVRVNRRKVKEAFDIPADQKVVFVVRIGGADKKFGKKGPFTVTNNKDMPSKIKKIFKQLGLKGYCHGVFVKVSKEVPEGATQSTYDMLKTINGYVTFGYPSMKTVRDLIYKRGHCYIKPEDKKIISTYAIGSEDKAAEKKKESKVTKDGMVIVPLNDNALIEKYLGQHDIIHIEDIINEIHTAGPNFGAVMNKFLCPFILKPPQSGFQNQYKSFAEGGDFGNRQDNINKLLEKLN